MDTTERDQFILQKESPPSKATIPKRFRYSSNNEKESVYALRNIARKQRVFHESFQPCLNTVDSKEVIGKVYDPETQVDPSQLRQNALIYLAENFDLK